MQCKKMTINFTRFLSASGRFCAPVLWTLTTHIIIFMIIHSGTISFFLFLLEDIVRVLPLKVEGERDVPLRVCSLSGLAD